MNLKELILTKTGKVNNRLSEKSWWIKRGLEEECNMLKTRGLTYVYQS